MILTHPLEDFRIYDRFKHDVLPLDRDWKYTQASNCKPNGVWFSVQADWDRWCRGDETGWTDNVIVYKVHVRPVEALLQITSVAELDAFTDKYGQDDRWSPGRRGYNIDWPAVTAEYPGIVIYPYIWERRLETPWYYTWDAASGCVWDLDLIRCVTPIFHTRDLQR